MGQGPLFIDEALEIVGPGANVLTISGANTNRIIDTSAPPGAQITLSGLRFANGYVDGSQYGGGAILHNSPSSLTISRSVLESNESGGPGGAIGSALGPGPLKIEQSTISGNSAEFGGGIGVYGGTMRVSDSTISGNTAIDGGAGVFAAYGTTKIQNSTISGNTVDASGSPSLGGGVLISIPKYFEIESSTITSNSAGNGGGGGVSVATYSDSSTPTVLHNSIIAGNTAGTDADLSGFSYGGANPEPVFSASYSLIGSTQGADVRTTVAGSNILNQGAALGPLADNGGPTRTHAIPQNSPAFDAGDPRNFLRTDQRGIARPQFTGPDMGSFELQDTEIPTTTINGPRKKIKTRKDKVTVRADFLASEAGSTFTCDLTGGKLESDPSSCTSPLRYELPAGSKKKTTYTLEVFATGPTGNVGPPVTAKTTFIKKPKRGKRK